jgi:four helix bundle protein
MARIEKFEDIRSWRKSRELTKQIYVITSQGHFKRDFGLRDQIRKASVSIVSNIAEGFERGGDQEFLQSLAVAKGSCGEVRAQLYIALDQGYLQREDFETLSALTTEISGLLAGLMKYLKQSTLRGSKYH